MAQATQRRHTARRKARHYQPGSVTFLQRFGGSLKANLHDHVVCLEGVFVDRTARAPSPEFCTPPLPRGGAA
jgi:hypothetical protein